MDNSRQLPNQNGGNALTRPAEVIYRDQEALTPLMEAASGSGLVEYWKVVLRHKATVLLLFVLGGLAGFMYTLPETPVYRAHATLEVQGLNENFLNMKDLSPTGSGSMDPTADILTQVKLLESRALRERAIAKLKAQPGAASATFVPNRFTAWKKALRLDPGSPLTWESALGMAEGSLTVRASGTTRIIDVASDSTDPRVAADFANTLVSEFIEQDLEGRLTTNERTGTWLSQQINDLKIQLEKSEDQMQSYASGVGLQLAGSRGEGKDGGDRENVADAKLRQLQTEMLTIQADRVTAQSKYELISSAPPESLPQVLDDAGLREYQSKLADLRRQLAELTASLTPANPKVQKVQAQISELENILKKERTNIITRIKNDFEAAARRERLITAEYETQMRIVTAQAGKSIHYDILKREADTNHQIYESMLQKVKEASIASAMRASNYRVVDPAVPPVSPYKPNPTQSATMGSLGGLIIGILFVLVRERADRSLQQPGDAAHFLNLPELGVIPSDRAGTAARLYGAHSAVSLAAAQSNEAQEVALATFKRRPSLMAESFHDTL